MYQTTTVRADHRTLTVAFDYTEAAEGDAGEIQIETITLRGHRDIKGLLSSDFRSWIESEIENNLENIDFGY